LNNKSVVSIRKRLGYENGGGLENLRHGRAVKIGACLNSVDEERHIGYPGWVLQFVGKNTGDAHGAAEKSESCGRWWALGVSFIFFILRVEN